VGNSISRSPDTCHDIKDSLVGDPTLEEENLSVEASLQGVDLLPLPGHAINMGVPIKIRRKRNLIKRESLQCRV
jgi:hypothetical protein